MDYAIICSGASGLLEVIRLTDWYVYEYKDFATVKSKETKEIEWFDEEYEAVDFMFEHFPKEMVDPKYYSYDDLTGNYFIE